MNIENLTEIAEWLEASAPPQNGSAGFCMNYFADETLCGTIHCICGAAVQFEAFRQRVSAEDIEVLHGGDIVEAGAYLLGLSLKDAYSLFYPTNHPFVVYGRIPPEYAARVIRNLMATGKVEWNLPEQAAA